MTRYKVAIGFLAAAAFGVVLFYVGLHPASGALGGIVHLLLGWLLPSLAVLALALGLAWFVPAPWPARIALALVLSCVLGLNTALMKTSRVFAYAPAIAWQVDRAILFDGLSDRSVAVKRRPWGPIFAEPFGPRVRLAGDEGCGCFYFLDPTDGLYSDRVTGTLFAVVGRRGAIAPYETFQDPTQEQRDRHIDLNLFERADTYYAVIDVYDRGTKIARFRHDGLPPEAFEERAGVGRGKFAVNFWANATDLLLHDNVWTRLLGRIAPSYFPEAELQAFFWKVAGSG